MADGSVRLDVDLSVSKAEKELAKLNAKIEKLEKQKTGDEGRLEGLRDRIRDIGAKLDEANYKVKELKDNLKYADKNDDKDFLREQIAEAVEEQKSLNSQSNNLNSEYDKIKSRIDKATESIEEMKNASGEMQRVMDAKRPAEALTNSITTAKKGFMNILKYAVGIRSLYRLVSMLRNGIVEGFKEFAAHDQETTQNITMLKNAVSQMKGAWGAAFAPVINAVIPILTKLIDWLTAAANAVARFLAIVTGKSTYQKAVGYTEALSEGMSDVADEAKEAKKYLMGIDELTIWSGDDNKTSSSKIGKSTNGGTKYETTPTNAGDMSFASRLGLSVRDVFFDWGDWNAEKILQKAIAFIPAAAGAVIGWGIGGFKGAVIGGLLGLAFGLVVDANSINGDGKLDLLEIVKSVLPVGISLLFAKSGHPVLGLALGLVTSFTLDSFSADGELNFEEVIKSLLPAFAVFLGVATGYPLIGITIGALISLLINPKIQTKIENGAEAVSDALEKSELNKGILNWQENAKKNIQNFVSGVFGEEALAKLRGDGEALGKSGVEGFKDGISSREADTKKESTGFFGRIVSSIKNFLGIHSPSTVFADIGHNIVQGFLNGISERWNTAKENIRQKFENLRVDLAGIVERIKSLFNFDFRLPKLKLPHLQVQWESAGDLASFFGINRIPHLSVQWYARGGIVDRTTLIGAGESGREAIVPLERNTEWINTVADGIIERITHKNILDKITNAMVNIPLPAMAMGTVVPPNSTEKRSQGISEETATWMIAQITNAVYGTANLVVKAINEKETNLSIDGMWAARRLYQPMQEVASEHGSSMIRGVR